MLLKKEDLPIVAMDFMNDVHHEDLDIINDLFELILQYENEPTNTNENTLNNKYNEWLNHTIAHFQREEVLMAEKNFPPYPFHKGEHDKALDIMNSVFSQWEASKDIQVLKRYMIEDLPQWLISHIQTMDTVTAMFFKTGLSPCAIK